MVRVTGKDDLNNVKGLAEAAFHDATLAGFRKQFVAASGVKEVAAAKDALDRFDHAVNQLRSHESEFNKRARANPSTLSVMVFLRPPAHSTAMRAFEKAKEDLRALNEKIGSDIIFQTDIHTAPHRLVRKKDRAPGDEPR